METTCIQMLTVPNRSEVSSACSTGKLLNSVTRVAMKPLRRLAASA